MARPRASAPGNEIDVSQDPYEGFDGIDWEPSETAASKAKRLTKDPRASTLKPKHLDKILSRWDAILAACESGYDFSQIAKSIGVSNATFGKFLAENPEARQEIVRAKMKPRDLCVRTILQAAKRGEWLPAAWWLERTCWQEFAKPEVKLQLLDRANNQNEVQQTFGGKTLAELNKELREQYNDNPDFKRALEQVAAQTAENGPIVDDGQRADDRPEGGS